MPANPPAAGGSGDKALLIPDTDISTKSRGRKRYCKKCNFTCTDAREFTAHISTHSDSDDHRGDPITSSSQISPALSSNNSQTRRVLRPKRSSKGSVSDINISVSNMEPSGDESVETTPSGEDTKTTERSEFPPLVMKLDTRENAKFLQNSNIQNMWRKNSEEENMDAEDDVDEPDAMTTLPPKDIASECVETYNLPNEITDNFSMDEDMDSEDRLVIDEESVAKTPTRLNFTHSRTYPCHLCEMTTTNAKFYLQHLKSSHEIEFRSYECRLCDYATLYKNHLNKHVKSHLLPEGDNPFISTQDSPIRAHANNMARLNSPGEASFQNSLKHSSFPIEETEEELDDENDGTDNSFVDRQGSSVPVTITSENIDQVLDEDKKKKKKTRQEVDPGKYFEAVDSSGTKYACSQCGNIYKWRKSLNKHWKEKHIMDPLVEVASPPGMLELLKSGKYTQLGARRIYDKSFLATIKTNKSDDPSIIMSSPRSHLASTPSPPNFLNSPQSLATHVSRLTPSTATLIPKMIGPFVASTAQPVFPGMPIASPHLSLHNSGYDSSEEGALDLTRDSKPSSRNSPYLATKEQDQSQLSDQEQPLDFSKSNKTVDKVKNGKPWDELSSLKPANNINQLIPRVHHCSKCDFTSSSEVEFANHTSSHLNKRIVRCYECKLQINSMDELNNHFIKLHFRKLTDYKEAIKKIPHGLQQTYHLLNMEIQDIGELGNQDLGAAEGKSLKCKKCDFEAKWPAELQKHAVSHSEERPYICMVCGSTYKWKWDLVKHFQKSHPNLPNPYRRNDKKDSPDGSSEDEDEPIPKRVKMEANNDILNGGLFNRDDNITVEGIIAATQAGQRLISSQPNILDDEPSTERNLAFFSAFPYTVGNEITQVAQIVQAAQDAQEIESQNKAHKAIQNAVKNRQNASCISSAGGNSTSGLISNKISGVRENATLSPSSGGTKSEELPYKCTMCNYHARWPSEVTQHMKNHSDSKPYLCPRCDYRSKWKWDVVKHLKRCGGGGINDVIDTTKIKKKEFLLGNGPPNVTISQQGKVKKLTSQPPVAYILQSVNENGQQGAMVFKSGQEHVSDASSGDDLSRPESDTSVQDPGALHMNNNDSSVSDSNTNNNYAAYTNGLPFDTLNSVIPTMDNSLSTMNKSSSSTVVSLPPSQSAHTSTFRQSAEVWNCPHCPFTTQSQAELKRHSGLHSDDKPFKCDVCQYSTRWACDLKKHRKSYNHFPKTTFLLKDRKEKMETPQGRFRCTQCSIFFQTLDNLLEHRLAEHIGQESSQNSPAPPTEVEIDMARIKHPRKQVKRIECPKCPFVCKSRNTMEKHLDEHEQLELSGILCFYCSSRFLDKESLLDHITTHSAFNPKEWETFFMISDEDQHQIKDHVKAPQRKFDKPQHFGGDKSENTQGSSSQAQKKYTHNEKYATDSTEARIQQILDEVPKQMCGATQVTPHQNKFKCEWCPAEFVNLTAVYKHASHAHPIQLKEQDISMALVGQGQTSKSVSDQQIINKKLYTGEPIDILRQQIAEKRNHIVGDNAESSSSEIQDDRGAKRYNCDRCNFSSANHSTFQRHYELHGSKLTSQCWFCDYSVDRMNLLYQHMKISHTRKWKALSQDPKYATQIQKMNQAFANSSIMGNNNDSPPDISQSADLRAVDLTSKLKNSETIHDIVYVTKQQHTWSGIPVNIVPIGNALSFVCPHCSFHNASIAETCCHVMQNHRAMCKFTCKNCMFSDDNIHVMSDHCKKEHKIHERVVEVLDFKQISFSELQIVQLNALREKSAHDLSRKPDSSTDMRTLVAKAMSCPFCPFKTLIMDHMKTHVADHGRQGQHTCQMCDFSSDFGVRIIEHTKVHDPSYTVDSRSLSTNALPLKVKKEPADRKIHESDSRLASRTPIQPSDLNHSDQEGSPRSKLSKRIRYRCSICPYHSTCRSNMVKHMRQHNNNKKYKCSKCSYGAARAVLLKNHLESHEAPIEDDSQYQDIICDPNSPDENFKAGEDNDSDDAEMDVEDFDDDDEDVNSDDSDDAKAIAELEAKDILEAEAAHKASILFDDSEGADKQFRKQKCPHCPFSSNSGYEYRKHLNFHGTQERYRCDHCSYSLDRLNLLTQHRRLHADEPGFNPNPPASDLLNTSFILQQSSEQGHTEELSDSVISKDGKSEPSSVQLSCHYCPYKSTKKKLFDIHSSNHGMRKRYLCDYCDWSADRIGLLYQHRIVHNAEPNYIPTLEEKIFLNHEFDDGASGEFEAKFMEIKNMDKPIEDGDVETPLSPPFKLTVVKKCYPCNKCPYKTSSKNSYTFHLTMHDSGAEFACTECSYASRNKGLLQQHLQLHISAEATSSSPTSSLLSSPFNRQQSMDMDTASAHQDGPLIIKKESQWPTSSVEGLTTPELKCQRCPFTAASQNALKEHLKCHVAQDDLACPFCDFTTASRVTMFPHIQIHFPSTKLEPEAMELMLEEYAKTSNNNIHNLNQNCHDDTPKSQSTPAKVSPPPQADKETVKTKRVYVCQFCEREFEAKNLMIQHERQHLMGSHSESKPDIQNDF